MSEEKERIEMMLPSYAIERLPFSLVIMLNDHVDDVYNTESSSITFIRNDEKIKISNEIIFEKIKEIFKC